MKKFLMSVLACIFVFSFGTVFATSDLGQSGETVYLEDYSQYQDILNNMDYQEYYKEMYVEMVSGEIGEMKNSATIEMNKAKVLDASDVLVEYGQYSQYYSDSFYKNSYQILSVEVLDGEYAGEIIEDVQYLLTVDTYENIMLAEVEKGDIINVYVAELEDGTLYAAATTYDAPVERWNPILILIMIGIFILIIYTGKHSAKFLIPLVVLADLFFIVAIPAICDGINVMFLVSFIVLLSTILISVLKFGVKAEVFAVILSTGILTLVLTMMIYGFNSLSRMNGITYDSAYTMESVLPRFVDGELVPTVNFNDLSIGITVLMMFFGILTIACKTVEIYMKQSKDKDIVKNTVENMQENLAENIMFILTILLVSLMPKFMLFIVNNSSFVEFVNSEILITEISRIIFILVGMAVTVPVTALLARVMDEEF